MLFMYGHLLFFMLIFSRSSVQENGSKKGRPAVDEGSAARLACILGTRRAADCPQDGGWGPWGAWGSCRGPCGAVGHRQRQRVCDNPAPERRGAPCAGANTQNDTCPLPGCSAREYEQLVSCDELRAQQLEVIKVVHKRFPALAKKCFVAACRRELVERVLKDGAKSYWIALHCVQHNIGCPVRGGWASWGEWTPCSAECGNGIRTRSRDCSDPPPSTPNLACAGTAFERHKCRGVACAKTLDGYWSEWGPWSECSAPCGDGVKHRERDCLPKCEQRVDRSVEILPLKQVSESSAAKEIALKLTRSVDAENRCRGPGFELAPCQAGPCDEDGGWSDWEDWSACSVSCGIGVQLRSRSCSRPMQSGDGVPCAGAVTEKRHCFKRPCTSVRHATALFSGGEQLDYDAVDRAHALLTLYLRFLPHRPTGQLAQRTAAHAASDVTLRMAAGWLVLVVHVDGCTGTVVSCEPLELHEWHDALALVIGQHIALRVDGAQEYLTSSLSCAPARPRLNAPMTVGRDFHGLVQFVAVNFRPLALQRERQLGEAEHSQLPASSSNAEVERLAPDIEEGFRRLRKGDVLSTPYPDSKGPWKMELSLRCDSDGVLVTLTGEANDTFAVVVLHNGHVYLAGLEQEPVAVEAEVCHGDWILVAVDRAGSVKNGKCCHGPCSLGLRVNGGGRVALPGAIASFDRMFIGSLGHSHQPERIGDVIMAPIEAVLGTLEVNGTACDLAALNGAQLVAQPAAAQPRLMTTRQLHTSHSYREVTVSGRPVNLSAVYVPPSECPTPTAGFWVRLGAEPNGSITCEEGLVAIDDGRTTRLTIEGSECREKVEGFYLVWAESGSGGRVVEAFGVVRASYGWTGVLSTGLLAQGAAALLFSVLYLIFACILCCCPPKLGEDCYCPPDGPAPASCPDHAPCPAPAPCPTTLPGLRKRQGLGSRMRSICSSASKSPDEQDCSARLLPDRGRFPARHALPATTADTQFSAPSESSSCPCPLGELSYSEPSLPSLPHSQLDGGDIECEMMWSDPGCRTPLPLTDVHYQAPGTVNVVVDPCVYSE